MSVIRLKLKRLKAPVNAGIEALERGEFAEFDDATLDDCVARAAMPVTKRAR